LSGGFLGRYKKESIEGRKRQVILENYARKNRTLEDNT